MIGRKGWVIGLVLGLEGLLGSREPAWAQAQPDAPADAGITVTTAPAGETVPRTEYDQLRRDMQRMQQRLDAVEGQQAATQQTKEAVAKDAETRSEVVGPLGLNIQDTSRPNWE